MALSRHIKTFLSLSLSLFHALIVVGAAANLPLYTVTELRPNDNLDGDNSEGGIFFGASVAAAGDIVAVGARGSVRVFSINVDGRMQMQQLQTLRAPLSPVDGDGVSDAFGRTVAIDAFSKTVVVGAPSTRAVVNGTMDPTILIGSVYIFETDGSGGGSGGNAPLQWTLQQKLISPVEPPLDGRQQFGRAVAIDGEYIVVGERTGTGFHVFRKTTNDGWVLLDGSDDIEQRQAGYSVAISGTTLAVGSYGGQVNIFNIEREMENYTLKLCATLSKIENGYFGLDVGLHGRSLIVGATQDSGDGSAFIYQKLSSEGEDDWKEVNVIRGEGLGVTFGTAVTIEGDNLVVGAPGDSNNTGAAFVYQADENEGWTRFTTTQLNTTGISGREVGFSADIGGGTIVVGVLYNGTDNARVYAFERQDENDDVGDPSATSNDDREGMISDGSTTTERQSWWWNLVVVACLSSEILFSYYC